MITIINLFTTYICILNLNKTSEIYLTQEVQDEKYEILFGDGFFGKELENGQTVTAPTNTTKPALFKINKCSLESLTTDFSTSGQPAFFQGSGNPVTTTLGLTFKETVLVTRNTISEGF